MAIKKGICKNYTACTLADKEEIQEVDSSEEYTCKECGKELHEIKDTPKHRAIPKRLIIIISAAIIIIVGVIVALLAKPDEDDGKPRPGDSIVDTITTGSILTKEELKTAEFGFLDKNVSRSVMVNKDGQNYEIKGFYNGEGINGFYNPTQCIGGTISPQGELNGLVLLTGGLETIMAYVCNNEIVYPFILVYESGPFWIDEGVSSYDCRVANMNNCMGFCCEMLNIYGKDILNDSRCLNDIYNGKADLPCLESRFVQYVKSGNKLPRLWVKGEDIGLKIMFSLNKETLSLNVGDIDTLEPRFNPCPTVKTYVSFSSNNETVAQVGNHGTIKAISEGEAIITAIAQSDNGNTDTAFAKVGVKSIAPTKTNNNPSSGKTKQSGNCTYNLGWGTYNGPCANGIPHGVHGKIKVTQTHVIDLRDMFGATITVYPGETIETKFENGKLRSGEIQRKDGETKTFSIF